MRKAFAGLAAAVAALLVLVIGAGAATTPQTVTPTNTTINGRVDALALDNGRLFVGGQMTAPFTRLGALNPSTGAVVWSARQRHQRGPRPRRVNGALYAGGDFGLRVYSLSSLSLLGTISCGSVRALEPAVDNLSVVVGGNFTTCGGQAHKNLALVNGTTSARRGRPGPTAPCWPSRPTPTARSSAATSARSTARLATGWARSRPAAGSTPGAPRTCRTPVTWARPSRSGPSTSPAAGCSPPGARASTRPSSTTRRRRPTSSGSGAPTVTPRPS